MGLQPDERMIIREMRCPAQVPERDMASAVARLVAQAYHEVKHAQYGTLMRMMDREEPFTLSAGVSTL